MRSPIFLGAVAGLASLVGASSPAVLAPLAQSHNGFATSLNPALTSVPMHKRDLPVGTCNAQTPCANGACCSKDNLCGYSDKSCGDGCQHNCDAKAQCGPYAPKDKQKCPLNVCCSEFGYCGSTSDFCKWDNKDDKKYPTCDTKYGGCGEVKRPSCSKDGNSVGKRNVGYYESWSSTRKCQKVEPEELALDGYTSINFAFSFFDPKSYQITPMDSTGPDLWSRFTALKGSKSGLQTWISVGGWSFTDPGPTQTAFSDMASNAGSRKKFIDGVIKFMDTYGFDGVDLDWEYPGADDRGGKDGDAANYVALCKEMKAAFGSKYGLTMTLPTSYWYLQHFDLPGVQEHLDWFNLMSYDLHGVWDKDSKFVGPYIAPHTNITEIDAALDLLWRAGVDSSKVVLGQGYYGRSFTLKDPKCNTPNGVCEFTKGANAGPCSNAEGILDYQEIDDIIQKNNLKPEHDDKAGVKWITWDNNQWISYDDADTFKQKRDFANSRCLGGMMVWAMDQVDQTKQNGFGAAPAAPKAQVDNAKQATADQQASLTCYTSNCGEDCKPGTRSVAQFNGQPGQLSTADKCEKKKYRNLCCDSKTDMGKCQWRGFRGSGMSCQGGCQDGETELTRNTNNHQKKNQDCHGGLQSFCCADFKPQPGTDLKKDLEDAAKAAAIAAAEQAALDIAAKAFCRVAVPALLAPLEALEDLIPIVGEILDIAEIAATPAIIEGCVKGIEKEGKSSFKVFGKEHTLKMDKPTEKPSNVNDRPPAKTDSPQKTADKDDPKKNDSPSCTKKGNAKRAGPDKPKKTIYQDTDKFKIMSGVAKRPDNAWSNCQGYAFKLVWPPTDISHIPEHYMMVAGNVVFTEIGTRQSPDKKKDQCDDTPDELIVRRDFEANSYDIRRNDLKAGTKPGSDADNPLPVVNPQTGQPLKPGEVYSQVLFMDRVSSAAKWDELQDKKTYQSFLGTQGVSYSDLGSIQRGWDNDQIKRVGKQVAADMGQYVWLSNNCNTFTDRLYDKLKAGTGLLPNPANKCVAPPPSGYFPKSTKVD